MQYVADDAEFYGHGSRLPVSLDEADRKERMQGMIARRRLYQQRLLHSSTFGKRYLLELRILSVADKAVLRIVG
jgi:hypothetical protein